MSDDQPDRHAVSIVAVGRTRIEASFSFSPGASPWLCIRRVWVDGGQEMRASKRRSRRHAKTRMPLAVITPGGRTLPLECLLEGTEASPILRMQADRYRERLQSPDS